MCINPPYQPPLTPNPLQPFPLLTLINPSPSQYFILEQFSTLKQYILQKHLFDYAASSPLPVSPTLWCLSWFWVVLSQIFLLYWAFAWTVSQGGVTLNAWGVNLGFSLLQDVLLVHTFRVYLIYRVLNKVAISYAQNELIPSQSGVGGDRVSVAQHTSPACRAARLRIAANLATGTILRNVDDVDVQMCRSNFSVQPSVLAVALLVLPLLVGFFFEALGDALLD
ncbi:hypothetical protein B484DRAFT_462540, partial [Ochromonadaceae sp. CCMP2298]